MPARMKWLGILSAMVALGGAKVSAQNDGERQWPFSVRGWVTFSSPVLSPDRTTVYVGVVTQFGGRVVAVATASGGSRWSTRAAEFTGAIESTPAVSADGSVVYVGSNNGKFYALRASDGSIIWERFIGASITSSPTVSKEGTIYFGSTDGYLYAVSPTGNVRALFQTQDFIESSPAIGADGTIYFGSYDKHFYAVTPNGEAKWSAPFATGGKIFTSPAIGADGTIYFGSYDQKMYALAPDGRKKWEYTTLGQIDSSPVLGADGTVYFAAAQHFYALRPEEGIPEQERSRWRVDIGSGSGSTAAVRADGIVIVGADDGFLRALRPEDGREIWRTNLRFGDDNAIESSPMIGLDGSIYVGSRGGYLFKVTGNGSPLSSYSGWPGFRRDTRHSAQMVVPNTDAYLVNLSTRAQAGGGRNLIAGFVANAPPGDDRAYLIRGVGPGLGDLGVGNFLPDPVITLFSGDRPFRTNDDWVAVDEGSGLSIPETTTAVQAFSLQTGSKDAVVLPSLASGAYSALVGSADGRAGVALVEVYDVRNTGGPSARLMNLSTRGFVGTGEATLIAGFVVGGTGPLRLLLRGVGPGLTQFGVSGALAQPRLALFAGTKDIASNTNWTSDGRKGDLAGAAASVSAFALVEGRADSAMLFEAQPGLYTLQITGVGNTTGEALVEIYVLP